MHCGIPRLLLLGENGPAGVTGRGLRLGCLSWTVEAVASRGLDIGSKSRMLDATPGLCWTACMVILVILLSEIELVRLRRGTNGRC